MLCAQTSDIVVQTSCKVWQSQDHLPHEGDGGAPGGGDGAVQAGCGPGLVLGAQGEDWCAERYCLNGDQSQQSNNIVLGWQLLYSRRFEAARRLPKYWGQCQSAFKLRRWDVAEGFLREIGSISAGFLERRGASLSPDQRRYVSKCVVGMLLIICLQDGQREGDGVGPAEADHLPHEGDEDDSRGG